MPKLNYSRQRNAIRDYLCHSAAHPTAEEIYQDIRKIYPKISLGTIYRNLSLLVSTGDAIRIQGNDRDHFDGHTNPHYHFICERCKQVYDVPMEPYDGLNEIAANSFPGLIRGHNTVFYGICRNCLNEQE